MLNKKINRLRIIILFKYDYLLLISIVITGLQIK